MAPSEQTETPEQAYLRLWPRLVRLGYLLTGSTAIGEDLAQDALVNLLRRWPVEAPDAYARRSVVNAATNRARRDARERRHLATLREGVQEPPATDDLWPLVRALPQRQRAVVVLRYYEDLAEREIAAAMGCRPGTVKSTASKALAALRHQLKEQAHDDIA